MSKKHLLKSWLVTTLLIIASLLPPNAIAANAVFWCIIGLFMGLVLDRTAKDIYAT